MSTHSPVAESLENSEKFQQLIQLLDESREDLHRAVDGIEEQICVTKPSTGGWSIIDVVEHLAILERRIPLLLETQLAHAERQTVNTAETEAKDAEVFEMVRSRAGKISAPDRVCPTGRYRSCEEAIGEFDAVRAATIAFVNSRPPYLRGRFLAHPILGPLDGFQWLLAVAAHTKRHTGQIEDTKQFLLER